jgi:hypothetical protein
MTLLGLIVAIAIIICMFWITRTFMPQPWQTPVMVILVLVALAFLIYALWPGAATMRIH